MAASLQNMKKQVKGVESKNGRNPSTPMTFEYYPHIFPFIISSIIIALLWLFTFQYRDESSTRAFWGLLLTIFIWSVGFIFEILGVELHTKIFFANIQFLGINAIPIAFLTLAIQNTDHKQAVRWLLYILGIFYLATTAVIWTNGIHHWFRQAPHLETVNGTFNILVNDYGFWFYYIQVPIHYAVALLTLIIIVRSRFFSSGPYRSQAGILLISFILPFIVDILYVFGITPIQNFNFTSAIFSISGIMIAYALYEYHLFDIVPMANDLIVNNFSEGVITLDLHNRVIGINPSACQIFRTNARDAIGKPVISTAWFVNAPSFTPNIGQKALTVQHNDSDGVNHYYDVTTLPIKNRKGFTVGTLITIKDVTELQSSFIEAHILAITDSLTGAYNRRHFIELLETELARAARLSLPLAVIMFDIDNFKQFNDTYGHSVGDEILIKTTKACQAHLRKFDLLGRYGGDEFVILLPQANADLASDIAERLCQLINSLHISVNDKLVSITISMGITRYQKSGKVTTDKLLRSADMAMYQAKQNGKNRFEMIDFEG